MASARHDGGVRLQRAAGFASAAAHIKSVKTAGSNNLNGHTIQRRRNAGAGAACIDVHPDHRVARLIPAHGRTTRTGISQQGICMTFLRRYRTFQTFWVLCNATISWPNISHFRCLLNFIYKHPQRQLATGKQVCGEQEEAQATN
jgi:hypothetical protein